MGHNRRLLVSSLVATVVLVFCGVAQSKNKTVYVHLLNGDDLRGNGSYERPYKSWRSALGHAGSGDTIIAKNGDYRKAGRDAQWGGLNLS